MPLAIPPPLRERTRQPRYRRVAATIPTAAANRRQRIQRDRDEQPTDAQRSDSNKPDVEGSAEESRTEWQLSKGPELPIDKEPREMRDAVDQQEQHENHSHHGAPSVAMLCSSDAPRPATSSFRTQRCCGTNSSAGALSLGANPRAGCAFSGCPRLLRRQRETRSLPLAIAPFSASGRRPGALLAGYTETSRRADFGTGSPPICGTQQQSRLFATQFGFTGSATSP